MDLLDVYQRLFERYGPQHWWPGAGGFETVAGAILTQHSSWRNAEQALENLRSAGALSPAGILELDEPALTELVRPAGCYGAKSRALRSFCEMLRQEFDGSLDACLSEPLPEARARLIGTRGVGPESADAILLYAGGQPTFVIDAYTRRILSRVGLSPAGESYEAWRAFFMSSLRSRPNIYGEFHALLVRLAKEACRPRPRCDGCPLEAICASATHRADVSTPAEFGVP